MLPHLVFDFDLFSLLIVRLDPFSEVGAVLHRLLDVLNRFRDLTLRNQSWVRQMKFDGPQIREDGHLLRLILEVRV